MISVSGTKIKVKCGWPYKKEPPKVDQGLNISTSIYSRPSLNLGPGIGSGIAIDDNRIVLALTIAAGHDQVHDGPEVLALEGFVHWRHDGILNGIGNGTLIVINGLHHDVLQLAVDGAVDLAVAHESRDVRSDGLQRDGGLQRGDLGGAPQHGQLVFQGAGNTQVDQAEQQLSGSLVLHGQTQLTQSIDHGVGAVLLGGGIDVLEQEIEFHLAGNHIQLELLDLEVIQSGDLKAEQVVHGLEDALLEVQVDLVDAQRSQHWDAILGPSALHLLLDLADEATRLPGHNELGGN